MDRRDAMALGALAGLGGLAAARPDQLYFPPRGGQEIPGARTPLIARQVIVVGTGTNSGIFVYSPTRGAGNLIATITAGPGTDPFGNAYLGGVTAYSQVATFAAAQLLGGILSFYTAGSQAGPWVLRALISGDSGNNLDLRGQGTGQVQALNQLSATAGLLVALGAAITGGLTSDTVTISNSLAAGKLLQVTNTTSTGGTPGLIQATVQAATNAFLTMFVSGDTNPRARWDTDSGGKARLRFGSGAANPDTGIYRAAANLFGADYIAFDNSGAAEVWNAPTFANSWTNSGNLPNLQYRRVAAPDNCVQWVGEITAPAGIAAGQAVITAVAAAYRPANTQSLSGVDLTTGGLVRFTMSTGGVLAYQTGSAAGHNIDIFAGNLVALTA